MTLYQASRTFAIVAAVALSTLSGVSTATAQRSTESALDVILQDVLGAATDAASREIIRNTGIDPLTRGYIPGRSYAPIPGGLSNESRRELFQLNDEHDRKIGKLEDELQRKISKAEAEFRRDAFKEDKPEKIREKRFKLQQKVDDAYAKFREKIYEENRRFDEKRDHILSKATRDDRGYGDDRDWDEGRGRGDDRDRDEARGRGDDRDWDEGRGNGKGKGNGD
jgi:hypothetical protein